MKNQEQELAKASETEVTFFIPNTEALGKLDELQPDFSLTIKYRSPIS